MTRAATHSLRPRLVAQLLVAFLLGTCALVLGPAPAHAASAGDFVSLINSARASNGLPGLSGSGDLASVAQGWAQQMANENRLYHNPSLGSQVSGYKLVGENVGTGPDDAGVLHNAFMNSSGHRANILNPRYTQVGVGVAIDGSGVLWVAEVFREPKGAAAPPPPPPPPAPAPAPVPPPAPPKPKPAKTTQAAPAPAPEAPAPAPAPAPEPPPAPAPPPPPPPEPPRPQRPADIVPSEQLAEIEATQAALLSDRIAPVSAATTEDTDTTFVWFALGAGVLIALGLAVAVRIND